MSSRSNATAATTKESNRVQVSDMKTTVSSSPAAVKSNVLAGKGVSKATNKEMPTSPTPQCPQRDELLGSLTTEQQQRTSARVIKKLRLDDAAADRDKKDLTECESVKIEDKDKHIVKQRMPKALWSSDEKDLFFEALNEFGKDFDAITSHICAKMKKRGVIDASLKNKHQVSHFYYRTWHKLSKYVHFDDNVKKVAQELYSLINYGELRKKCSSVSEKVCARLSEMVAKGGIVMRLRGRNLRVRTPMCRALRRLNQITERSCGPRTCTRTSVVLHARDEYSWSRVQSAAHNPRLAALLPLPTLLTTFITALSRRWGCEIKKTPVKENKEELNADDGGKDHDADQLQVEVDRVIKSNKLTLHVGPRANAEIHLPTISPCEQLSSQKICFTSYLERMEAKDKGCGPPKIRTPKRQRKDSTNDKEKDEQKKIKVEEPEHKLMDIDETAIDGIELMASITETKIQEEEKPTAEIEDNVLEEDREEKDKEKETERENYSFLEMEDDEKYNKSDTDNESDNRCDKKSHKDRKFKNLKVKFRIRPKKQGGSVYTVVTDAKENIEDGNKTAEEAPKVADEVPKTNEFLAKKETAEAKSDLDVENVIKQVRTGWSICDAGQLTIGDLYLMFGSRSRIELDYWWAEPSQPICNVANKVKSDNTKVDKASPKKENDDGEKLGESDNELLSPKHVSQDSNDGLSGDERKVELSVSPEHKGQSLRVADKLVNKVRDTRTNHRNVMNDRLRRLVSLASSINPRCTCSQTCHIHRRKPNNETQQCSNELQLFRHPTPIAPKSDFPDVRAINMTDVPRWKRGRPRNGTKSSVVVQRLLPLLPKPTPPSHNLIPVKLVSNPPKILPKPPATTPSTEDSCVFVSRCGDKYVIRHDNNVSTTSDTSTNDADAKPFMKTDSTSDANFNTDSNAFIKEEALSGLLSSESQSITPSQLLRAPTPNEREAWFGDQDFSLSSFLAHLEHKPNEMGVDSQVHSLLTETSVDYVAKFADLAAELSADNDKSNSN